MKLQLPIRLRSSRSISIFLVALFALSSCDVYPESGKWDGDLNVTDDVTHESYRCQGNVDLTRTSEMVLLRNFDLYCGSHSVHWSPDAYTRRGSELFRDGRKAGDIYPDGTVRLDLVDPYFNDRYPNRVGRVVLTWSRMGDSLHFSLREETDGRSRMMEGSLRSTF